MACGNNMVSRSGLQSQPTAMSHPTVGRIDASVRQQALETARHADRQVSQAQQAVLSASTEADLECALKDAEKALSAARRTSGDRQAKFALRALERQVDQLRRDANAKQHDIAGREHHQREQSARMAVAAYDHMSPLNLGVLPKVIHAEAGAKGRWSKDLSVPPPDAAVVVDNRAVFETDRLGRTVRAVTVLDQLAADTDRNPTQQRGAGGTDRLSTDHGGHIFGTLFGGFGEAINIQAVDSSINLSAYRRLETLWKEQIMQGGQVHLEVNFHFTGDSRRADHFEVTFDLGDGEAVSIPFYQ